MRSRKRQGGFTLIELLIVVVVIAVVSAIAIPGLLNAVDRGKQKRTMSDLRAIATALQAYAIDQGSYPDIDGTANVLIPHLRPYYLRTLPTEDGWGRDMLYARLDRVADGADYILWSLGKDGQDDGTDGDDGATHDLNADIVIFDGQFSQWPSGIQE